MTIDEEIEKYKAITNTNSICPMPCMSYCEKCIQESEQLKEWLEELKELRETSYGYSKEDIELNRKTMYNKAIDDFVKLAKEHEFKYGKKDISNCVIGFIEFFAEQLKESD